MQIKDTLIPDAILFDMDGVLIDSFKSWWKSLNKAMRTYDKTPVSKEKFEKKYWGYTLEENLEDFGIDTGNKQFCNLFYNDYLKEIVIFPQTTKTLSQLSSYTKAIITNAPALCTNKILEYFSIKKFFNVIITSDMVTNGKPQPDSIYMACEQLQVRPEKVVLVGDTKNDVQAGHAAGCITIGINVDADYTINHIGELLNIIKI
jgi:HAD superfamily hydrolase (TIGR01509 family)